ncbi:MAG: SUKH-3 domain-containing protein [Proteobacteria bacterium]|nr:SUKH-3 domain-containing protein [Pseudomonadota bacterium]
MLSLPELIEPLFKEAGWSTGFVVSPPEWGPMSASQRASAIIEKFGGLQVGKTGPGTEQAAADVCFYSEPRPEVSAIANSWPETAGRCEAFGTAHHDHIVLLVNDEGTYFAFTDPDDSLYSLGASFGEAMKTLLWGKSYGTPLTRDLR